MLSHGGMTMTRQEETMMSVELCKDCGSPYCPAVAVVHPGDSRSTPAQYHAWLRLQP